MYITSVAGLISYGNFLGSNLQALSCLPRFLRVVMVFGRIRNYRNCSVVKVSSRAISRSSFRNSNLCASLWFLPFSRRRARLFGFHSSAEATSPNVWSPKIYAFARDKILVQSRLYWIAHLWPISANNIGSLRIELIWAEHLWERDNLILSSLRIRARLLLVGVYVGLCRSAG